MASFQHRRASAADGYDLRSYNELQLEEILRHKWIESEKAGRDLGEDAVRDWIQRYAASFREALLGCEIVEVTRLEARFEGDDAG